MGGGIHGGFSHERDYPAASYYVRPVSFETKEIKNRVLVDVCRGYCAERRVYKHHSVAILWGKPSDQGLVVEVQIGKSNRLPRTVKKNNYWRNQKKKIYVSLRKRHIV